MIGGYMRVLVKQPGKKAITTWLENKLEALQRFVGGYVECILLDDSILMICNEEGKLLNMPVNFILENDVIVGPVIFCGINGDKFDDLPDGTETKIRTMIGE